MMFNYNSYSSLRNLRLIVSVLLFITLFFVTSGLNALLYQQVSLNGFGDPGNNKEIYRAISVFDGHLYVGTSGGVAEIWRTSDGITWNQTGPDGLGNANNAGIYALEIFGTNIYAGTANFSEGAEIWRSHDSTIWNKVRFSNNNNTIIYDLEVFDGYLYAGIRNAASGSEIWRSSDGTTWQSVSQAANGFGTGLNRAVLCLKVFNNTLYAGTWSFSGGQIWQSSDGTNWQSIAQANNGFGNNNNLVTISFEVFNSNIYAGTVNYATGGEVWRSFDGDNWMQVSANGFGDGNNNEILCLKEFNGVIYAGILNNTTGCELWGSSDGMSWAQENIDGFGNTKNINVASLETFDNKLFCGIGNITTGCEIWYGWHPPCSINIIKNADTPGGNIYPYQNNVSVLAFNISDSLSHNIKTIKICNEGTMQDNIDISAIKLWNDINANNLWDAGDIQINGAGIWNPLSQTWNFTNLSIPSGQNIIAAINISGTAENSRTFRAKIKKGSIMNMEESGIFCQTNNIITNNIINANTLIIAAGIKFAVPYFDNMESGTNNWGTEFYGGTVDNLWHQTSLDSWSPNTSWWVGQEATGDYNTGNRINNALISPPIDLTLLTTATLSFQEKYETEEGFDNCIVDISTNKGNNWVTLRVTNGSSSGWTLSQYDLSAYAGKIIKIRFYFDTTDGWGQNYSGWFIDDVSVTSPAFPYIILAKNTDVPGKLVTPGSDTITILAFNINDPSANVIEIIKIGNIGTMINNADVTNVKIWYDINVNNQWDTNDIQIGGNGIWNPATSTWDFTGISVLSTNIVATIDISSTAINGNTFRAVINISNVINTNGNYNINAIINANEIIIPIPPEKPTGLTAATISNNQINLTWNNLPNETSYTLFRSILNDTNNLTNIAGLSADVTNYNDTGLTLDTTYYYWVKAYNPSGLSGFSSVASNTTFPLPPEKPTGLKATVVSTNQINLSWDDLSTETSYTLFRNTANDTNNLTNIDGLSTDITNYNDIGLTLDTTYYYWVKAYNTGGALGFSSVASNTTFPLPPEKPTGLEAISVSTNQINLLWNDLSTETFYILFRSVKNNTNAAKIVSKLSINNTYYKDTILEPDTTYYYWIKACNPGGSSPFSDVAYATTKPRVPEELLMNIYNNKVECFNSENEAILHFEISEKEIDEEGYVDVKIRIYDVNGELVDTPVNDKYCVGFHDEPWPACEKAGSGVYVAVFEIGEEKKIMKIMVVK